MTARNWQDEAKSKGLPWTRAKGCATWCAVGDFIPKGEMDDEMDDVFPRLTLDIQNQKKGELTLPTTLSLSVDGMERQRGTTADMLWSVDALVAHISELWPLEEGDLILTGTPAGVGEVRPGQSITATLGGRSYGWKVEHASAL